MNNRNALVVACGVAFIVVAIALFITWQKDGRANPGLIIAIPVLLIALAAAFRKKT